VGSAWQWLVAARRALIGRPGRCCPDAIPARIKLARSEARTARAVQTPAPPGKRPPRRRVRLCNRPPLTVLSSCRVQVDRTNAAASAGRAPPLSAAKPLSPFALGESWRRLLLRLSRPQHIAPHRPIPSVAQVQPSATA
jgi:hypothetical protein